MKHSRDLQEFGTIEKLKQLIGLASELPVFVNMHFHVSLIDGRIAPDWGKIKFCDESIIISEKPNDYKQTVCGQMDTGV